MLGANDGIVSSASLVLGVVAAGASHHTILMTGVSGLIAGAMSKATGEFVSVHSQQDTEKADLAQERAELNQDPMGGAARTGGHLHRAGFGPAAGRSGSGEIDGP